MPQRYQTPQHVRYGKTAALAVQPIGPLSVSRPVGFEDRYRRAWRRIHDAKQGMPRPLAKFTHDQTRDDVRYPPQWLHSAIAASLHTPNISIALSWVEVARAEILAQHPLMRSLCWATIHTWESMSNARGDIAFDRVMREGTEDALDDFVEAMLEQKIASRLAADASHLIMRGRLS